MVFFFKQKTAYEMRISDWSSDVCSSDLLPDREQVSPSCFGVARASEDHGVADCLHHRIGSGGGFSHEMGQSLSSWMGGAIEQSLSAGSFVRTGGVGRALRAWSGPRCRLIGQSLAGSEEHTSELQSLMRISYAVF